MFATVSPQKRVVDADSIFRKGKKQEELTRASASQVRRARSESQGQSAFVAVGSQMQGLRSRRSSAHRRNNLKGDEDIAHPLKASSSLSTVAAIAAHDSTITRPLLRRWLSASEDGEFWNESASNGEDDGTPDEVDGSIEGEVLVIEHKVSKEDSLAGVALKYGISLAELRRVNQMWASDTIHFRKTLYIPLHSASKRYAELLLENRPSRDDEIATSSNAPYSVKRVPASQLSFFPPSNSRVSLAKSSHSAETITSLDANGDSPWPLLPTISSRKISAFIRAIPLPSPDTLMSRLSIDSNANSSRSETSSEREHELLPMKSKDRISHSPTSKRRSPNTIIDRGDALIQLPVLQTEQMKPSPRMELPKSMRRVNS